MNEDTQKIVARARFLRDRVATSGEWEVAVGVNDRPQDAVELCVFAEGRSVCRCGPPYSEAQDYAELITLAVNNLVTLCDDHEKLTRQLDFAESRIRKLEQQLKERVNPQNPDGEGALKWGPGTRLFRDPRQ